MKITEENFFTIILFILVVSIIFICDDLSKSALIISSILGFVILNTHINKQKQFRGELPDEIPEFFGEITPGRSGESSELNGDNAPVKRHLAEREYELNKSYERQMNVLLPIPTLGVTEGDSSMDSANTRMVRERTRDKRAMTSATIKDAGFYRNNYGDEFDAAEKRPWWGNSEL